MTARSTLLPSRSSARETVPSPVDLAILAIDRIAPASLRACSIGREVRVAVSDEATAAVFRAALAVTAQFRSTDRLVEIVVEPSRGSRGRIARR